MSTNGRQRGDAGDRAYAMTELQQLLMIFKILSIPHTIDENCVVVASTHFVFDKDGCFVQATGPRRKSAARTIYTRTDGKYQDTLTVDEVDVGWKDAGNYIVARHTVVNLLAAMCHALGTDKANKSLWIGGHSVSRIRGTIGHSKSATNFVSDQLHRHGHEVRVASEESDARKFDVVVTSPYRLSAALAMLQSGQSIIVWATSDEEFGTLADAGGGDITV